MTEDFQPEVERPFPAPPVAATDKLVPITSWAEMHREVRATGVEFEEFWYDSVMEGVAYFFSWRPDPRATVLVVWEATGPTHVESRNVGDALVAEIQEAEIRAEVIRAFHAAGYPQEDKVH